MRNSRLNQSLLLAGLFIVTGFFIVIVYLFISLIAPLKNDLAIASHPLALVQTVDASAPAEPSSPASTPVPARAPQDTSTVQPIVTTAPVDVQAPDPTALMTGAGIHPAFQDIASQILFDGNGLITTGGGYIAYLAPKVTDVESRITLVNQYVINRYGTWAEAVRHSNAFNGNW